jgi:molybdate transport system substrate-binding protein
VGRFEVDASDVARYGLLAKKALKTAQNGERMSGTGQRRAEDEIVKHLVSWIAVVVFALGVSSSLHAQDEITLLAPGIMQEPLKPLIESFEAKTGHKVKATYGQEDGTKQQIIKGEPFDVPVLETTGKTPIADVIASGNVVANSGTPVAKISIGVAVLKGAPKPDISTAAAVKRMMLNAKAISYPDLAQLPASGISVNDAIKGLGIADQMQPKTKFGRGGAGAMALVVSGDAEIGFTFLPGIVNPGVDLVGTLPPDVCPPTVVEGFVSSHAKDPAAAKELLAYISSPDAAATYKASKMDPGR